MQYFKSSKLLLKIHDEQNIKNLNKDRIRVLQRNRTNRLLFFSLSLQREISVESERQRDNYFKELAPAVVNVWQVQNLQDRLAGWRPKEELQFTSKGDLLAEFPLILGRSVFCC